jgi:ubiquinone/menaquinone biosynthesis C-methylase UbiE
LVDSTLPATPDVPESVYLDLQAALGITKHMGGMTSTEELADRCHIEPGKKVLDVGCGTGKTPCYLASTHGCSVIAVDINRSMLSRSRERARRERLGNSVRFELADAQNLPYDDCHFDVILCESVTAFVGDKAKTIGEYARVVKPRGYIGLNETTWVREPPPARVVEYVFQTTGARPETARVWQEMLGKAGLRNPESEVHEVTMLSEWVSEMKWLDMRDLLGPWFRLIPQYLANADTRRFVRTLWPAPSEYFEYFGYGLYTARK